MSAANALSSDQPSKPPAEPRAAEPSMEDILASIRRIIADDQSRSLASVSNAYRRAATQNVTPPPSLLSMRPEPASPPVEPDVAAPEPQIVHDRAAPVDRTQAPPVFADRGDLPSGAVPHLNAPALPSASVEDLSVIAEIVSAGAASILVPLAPPLQDVMQPSSPRQTTREPEPVEPSPAVLSLHGFEAEAERETVAPVFEPVAPTVVSAAAPVESLLSAAVGASIESSFQTLATSVFLQNSGAVEGMVREMLRPMLKTWLDDNLPTIVERLVRIEIERVARGTRG